MTAFLLGLYVTVLVFGFAVAIINGIDRINRGIMDQRDEILNLHRSIVNLRGDVQDVARAIREAQPEEQALKRVLREAEAANAEVVDWRPESDGVEDEDVGE